MKPLLKLISGISLLLVASLVAGGTIWMSAQEPGPVTGEYSTSFVGSSAELTIKTQKMEFNRGENIEIKLTVKNYRDENVSFTFPNEYQYDFVVYDENFSQVWVWSEDKMFAQVLTDFTLGPGESREVIWNWDQRIYDPNTGEYSQIASGIYHLRGVLVGHLETPHLKIIIL
jgi:hypothetical protein